MVRIWMKNLFGPSAYPVRQEYKEDYKTENESNHIDTSTNSYTTTKTKTVKTNTINVALTKAHIWYMDYDNAQTYVNPIENTTKEEITHNNDVEIPDTTIKLNTEYERIKTEILGSFSCSEHGINSEQWKEEKYNIILENCKNELRERYKKEIELRYEQKEKEAQEELDKIKKEKEEKLEKEKDDKEKKKIQKEYDKKEKDAQEKIEKIKKERQQELDNIEKEVEKNITLEMIKADAKLFEYYESSLYDKNTNIKEIITNTVSTQKYIPGTPTVTEKPEKFAEIFQKEENSKARQNIRSSSAWLFESMEANDATKNMVELMKYLLYKADEYNYYGGVTELDFAEFAPGAFGDISIVGNNIQDKVWCALIDAGFTEYAAAGAMGNFMVESGYATNNLENSSNSQSGVSDEEFTERVNNGSITKEEFVSSETFGLYKMKTYGSDIIYNSYGYGLAQWTFPTRKQALYEATKGSGSTIDDVDAQVRYLVNEIMTNYRGVPDCQKAKSVAEACEIFQVQFEGAADAHLDRRIEYAEEFYKIYQGKTSSDF